jgi:hypothetical protein
VEFDATDAAQLRAAVEEIAYRHEALKRLPDQAWEELTGALVHAVEFAKAGLADILAGKDKRSAAWTTDILVKDVCDALRAVGLATPMAAHRDESLAQKFASELAEVAGLPDQGELFKSMQRARRIEKAGGATCPGKPTLILGQWRVLGKKADLP